MQSLDRLEDNHELALPARLRRVDELGGLGGELALGERLVDPADMVLHRLGGLGRLGQAGLVDFAQQTLAPLFLAEGDRGLEREELAHLRHVDAIAIRVPDLRRGRGDDNLARVRTGEDAQDGLTQGGAADDGVVDADQGVALGDCAVGDVVDVRGHLHAALFLRDEGAQLDVLVGHLLPARPVGEDESVEQGLIELARGLRREDVALDRGAPAAPQLLHQAVPGNLGRVGDVGEDRALEVAADFLDDAVGEGRAQRLALGVDVRVVAAGEVDALERAMLLRAGGQDGLDGDAAVGLDHEGAAGLDLAHLGLVRADDGHERGALGGDRDGLFGAHPPAGADAVGVAEHEAIAIAD